MTSWGGMVRRSGGKEERTEDINNPGIHNTYRLGNKHIFSDEQLKLIEDILKKGDDYFKVIQPESEEYFLGKKLYEEIPVYLIPYEKYLVEMENRCKSPFANEMRKMCRKEMARIPQECNPEERERRVARIKAKYSPWLPEKCPGSCKGCVAVEETSLGYFVPDDEGGKIYICLDKIIEKYPGKVDSIAAKVLLHELGHAIMFNSKHQAYETCFEYWAEESLANKIALNYLAVASKNLGRSDLYSHAKAMVSNQKEPYRFGLYLHGHNASDWASLRDNKTNICEVFADMWVDSSCDQILSYRTVGFAELQRLFFRALDGKSMVAPSSGFETWVFSAASGVGSVSAQKYLAFVTSPYIGLVFREMVGWCYNTIADCKSSTEIRMLIDRIGSKGAVQIDKDFNSATYGGALSSLNKYYQYLLSLHL